MPPHARRSPEQASRLEGPGCQRRLRALRRRFEQISAAAGHRPGGLKPAQMALVGALVFVALITCAHALATY